MRIVLREHGTTSTVPLTDEVRDLLLGSEARIKCSPSPGQRGCYDLRPGSRVGVVVMGDTVVEIRPKLSVSRLMWLLGYAGTGLRLPSGDVELERSDLGEAVAALYGRMLGRALRRGIPQGYRVREEALAGVKGRVRFADQMRRRLGLAPPVEVTYDDFTEDVEENRVLRAALIRLLRLPLRFAATRRLLSGLDRVFERVRVVEYSAGHLPALRQDRLVAHLGPALRLARVILEGSGLGAGHGATPAPSFLIDMNVLFEEFLWRALRERLGLTKREFPRGSARRPLHLDTDRRVRLRPDLSWWQGSRAVFVGDAKYKRLKASGILHPDLYQLLAYATALDLDDALVVYAAGESEPATHAVRYTGKRLHVRVLDLNGTPDEVMGRVGEVASLIQRLKAGRLRRSSR